MICLYFKVTKNFTLIISFLRVLDTSFLWWSFTGVWLTASFLRPLPSILTNLNNTVVWMVSILPLISNSSSLIYQTFGNRSKRAKFTWYYRHLHVSRLFQLWQNPRICLSFCFLILSLYGSLEAVFFSCSLTRGLAFRLGLTNLFVLQNPSKFWFVHELIVAMFKF